MAQGIITEYMKNCILCGTPVTEIHHCCYGRAQRQLADKDGLIIPICRDCHGVIHNNGVAGKLSKIVGQLAYEKRMIAEGKTETLARELFRKRYGGSYL